MLRAITCVANDSQDNNNNNNNNVDYACEDSVVFCSVLLGYDIFVDGGCGDIFLLGTATSQDLLMDRRGDIFVLVFRRHKIQ